LNLPSTLLDSATAAFLIFNPLNAEAVLALPVLAKLLCYAKSSTLALSALVATA